MASFHSASNIVKDLSSSEKTQFLLVAQNGSFGSNSKGKGNGGKSCSWKKRRYRHLQIARDDTTVWYQSREMFKARFVCGRRIYLALIVFPLSLTFHPHCIRVICVLSEFCKHFLFGTYSLHQLVILASGLDFLLCIIIEELSKAICPLCIGFVCMSLVALLLHVGV